MATVTAREETAEEELEDLLSCHRSASSLFIVGEKQYIYIYLYSINTHIFFCESEIGVDQSKYIWSKYLAISHRYFMVSCDKESLGPYAWRTTLGSGRKAIPNGISILAMDAEMPPTSRDFIGLSETDFQTRLQDLQSKASDLPISFCLPKLNAVAGAVLQHGIKVIEKTFSKQDPCIFKVGFTHNPVFRWCNDTYGYAHSVEKWSGMTVFYASPEPFSAAMLESALIEKYQSISAAKYPLVWGSVLPILWYHATCSSNILSCDGPAMKPANIMCCSKWLR